MYCAFFSNQTPSPMPSIFVSDTQLVFGLKAGDEDAFRQIYDRYWHKLYRVAVGKVKAIENAKEIVQDIFLDLWLRHADLDIETLDHYLFSAVKFKVLDYFKHEIVRQNHRDFLTFSQSDADWDTEQEIAYNDLNQSIIACIDQLPPKTKQILELSRLQHKSNMEIADLLGISHRTVEYHIAQGLQNLRLYLRDYIILLLVVLHQYLK